MHRAAPTTENYPVQNDSSAEGEKSCSKIIFLLFPFIWSLSAGARSFCAFNLMPAWRGQAEEVPIILASRESFFFSFFFLKVFSGLFITIVSSKMKRKIFQYTHLQAKSCRCILVIQSFSLGFLEQNSFCEIVGTCYEVYLINHNRKKETEQLDGRNLQLMCLCISEFSEPEEVNNIISADQFTSTVSHTIYCNVLIHFSSTNNLPGIKQIIVWNMFQYF